MGWNEVGWDGVQWDGVGGGGVGWDGVGWDGRQEVNNGQRKHDMAWRDVMGRG